MAAKKADSYGCKVPKGGKRKGCGGGAKVFELNKKIEKVTEMAKRHEKNLATYKKQVAARLAKKANKK